MTVLTYRRVSDSEMLILNPESNHIIFKLIRDKRFARNAIHTIYKNDDTPYATLRRGMGGKVCLLASGTECSFREFLKAKGMFAELVRCQSMDRRP
jgi:hypothetical protein